MSEIPIVQMTPSQLRAFFRQKITGRNCPWCGACHWDDGSVVVAPAITKDDTFEITKGLSRESRVTIQYDCQQCRFVVSFGLGHMVVHSYEAADPSPLPAE